MARHPGLDRARAHGAPTEHLRHPPHITGLREGGRVVPAPFARGPQHGGDLRPPRTDQAAYRARTRRRPAREPHHQVQQCPGAPRGDPDPPSVRDPSRMRRPCDRSARQREPPCSGQQRPAIVYNAMCPARIPRPRASGESAAYHWPSIAGVLRRSSVTRRSPDRTAFAASGAQTSRATPRPHRAFMGVNWKTASQAGRRPLRCTRAVPGRHPPYAPCGSTGRHPEDPCA